MGLNPRISRKERLSQIVKRFYAALNNRDWKRVAQLCTPDVAVLSPKAPAAASSSHEGLSGYRAALEKRFLALPSFRFEELAVFARPIGVAVRFIGRWESRDGRVHHAAGSALFEFQGERIAKITGVF